MSIDATTSLADLVIADGRRAAVLERLGLDYCCHGQRSLEQAATEARLDVDDVRRALDLPEPPAQAPAAAPTGSRQQAELAHDIVDTHHAYMWEEMPRLAELVAKVHRVHGDRHPELARVHELFDEAVAALAPHMTTEERSVFPAISRLEKTCAPGPDGRLAEQIDQLVEEHAAVGDLFGRLATATGGYAAPPDACGSYRAMLEGLQTMERDLHEHIHKENNILFPAAIALQDALAGRTEV
ncbi:iron-sulfur cluster repair di-iron protein [Nocardioides ferulae]|uniref:iron-sulfur cluster repair di-iron protein n=1 Tax=Nocardioides ferulae TaxID=2340821 RepID=UPI000EB4F745|nr:iron-sulfur cluster repair di-iron protein [Nocardioides ferulae]